MAKAILTTKVDPTYDDLPEQGNHFPCAYLCQLRQRAAIGILAAKGAGAPGQATAFAVPAILL